MTPLYRSSKRIFPLLLMAAMASSALGGEVHSCRQSDGSTVFQSMPCKGTIKRMAVRDDPLVPAKVPAKLSSPSHKILNCIHTNQDLGACSTNTPYAAMDAAQMAAAAAENTGNIAAPVIISPAVAKYSARCSQQGCLHSLACSTLPSSRFMPNNEWANCNIRMMTQLQVCNAACR